MLLKTQSVGVKYSGFYHIKASAVNFPSLRFLHARLCASTTKREGNVKVHKLFNRKEELLELNFSEVLSLFYDQKFLQARDG